MQKEQQNKKFTFAPAISTSYLLYPNQGWRSIYTGISGHKDL